MARGRKPQAWRRDSTNEEERLVPLRRKPKSPMHRVRPVGGKSVTEEVYGFLGDLAALDAHHRRCKGSCQRSPGWRPRRGRLSTCEAYLREHRDPFSSKDTPGSIPETVDLDASSRDVSTAGSFCTEPPDPSTRSDASTRALVKRRSLVRILESYIRAGIERGKRRAKRYVCKALSFGVNSGYLIPADPDGQVLRVSPTLSGFKVTTKKGDGNVGGRRKKAPKKAEGRRGDADRGMVPQRKSSPRPPRKKSPKCGFGREVVPLKKKIRSTTRIPRVGKIGEEASIRKKPATAPVSGTRGNRRGRTTAFAKETAEEGRPRKSRRLHRGATPAPDVVRASTSQDDASPPPGANEKDRGGDQRSLGDQRLQSTASEKGFEPVKEERCSERDGANDSEKPRDDDVEDQDVVTGCA